MTLLLGAYPQHHAHIEHAVMVDPLGQDFTRPDAMLATDVDRKQ